MMIANKFVKTEQWQNAKNLLDKAITVQKLDENHPKFFMLNGLANLKLGYLLVAETMFKQCLLSTDLSV